jgi:predicted alpha/beta-fold hydrolase
MTALDDPIVIRDSIDFDGIRANPNCTLATSNFGGHMGYYENPFSSSQWCAKPALDFLYILCF